MHFLSVEKLKNEILEDKLTKFDYFLYFFFSWFLLPLTVIVISYVVLYNNVNVTVKKKMDRYIRKLCAIYFSSTIRLFIIYFVPLFIIRFIVENLAGIEINQNDEFVKTIFYVIWSTFVFTNTYIVTRNYQDLNRRYFAKNFSLPLIEPDIPS